MNSDFVRERITQLRMQKGVSEYKMSYDLGHSRGYINNISSGKSMPSVLELFAICDYFDITPMEFFQENTEDPKLYKEIIHDLEQLNTDDLQLIHNTIKRLLQK